MFGCIYLSIVILIELVYFIYLFILLRSCLIFQEELYKLFSARFFNKNISTCSFQVRPAH
jgi:hypothetical protein